ncbi:phospho-N-acetylmuramoyl-pentapeptide-transferase [Thermodesulfobacteriota bacterium]
MLYKFLYSFHNSYSVFNVFRYTSFRIILSTLTALFISFIVGPWMIKKLSAFQISQTIREDGPKSHLVKEGTPTMGGTLILFSVITSTVLWSNLSNLYIQIILAVTVCFGAIGFYDDYKKISGKNTAGLRGRYKFLLQVIFSLVVGYVLYTSKNFPTTITIPFFKNLAPDLGIFYILFAVFVISGSSNAVNLTDGLDGLAIGPIIITAATYLLFAFITGHWKFSNYLNLRFISGCNELAIYCGAVVGSGLGFLWFNTYPAQVFMGDVGSISLGAAIGTIAIITKQELVLAIVGGIFVLEAVSVIIQVLSFKTTGKRVLRMAPIHHHFELKGWAEPKIIVRFWIISMILALAAISTLKLR